MTESQVQTFEPEGTKNPRQKTAQEEKQHESGRSDSGTVIDRINATDGSKPR